jgi:hypothetical protein
MQGTGYFELRDITDRMLKSETYTDAVYGLLLARDIRGAMDGCLRTGVYEYFKPKKSMLTNNSGTKMNLKKASSREAGLKIK